MEYKSILFLCDGPSDVRANFDKYKSLNDYINVNNSRNVIQYKDKFIRFINIYNPVFTNTTYSELVISDLAQSNASDRLKDVISEFNITH